MFLGSIYGPNHCSHYNKQGFIETITLTLYQSVVLLSVLSLCSLVVINFGLVALIHDISVAAAGVFQPGALNGTSGDAGLATFVHRDDEGNIYFDIYAVQGEDNRIMYAKNDVLVVSIGPSDDIHTTVEHHLWKFIATILEVDMSDIEILLFPGEIGRRVLLRNSRMSLEDCIKKIKEYLQPYISLSGRTPGERFLHPYAPLAVYAQNNTDKDDGGQWKYYDLGVPGGDNEENMSDKKSEKYLREKLLEMKPFYEKNPSLMAKIFRDLRIKQEVIFRGRLAPGSPVKPILDDYRGKGKVKLIRRILEGMADGRVHKKEESKIRLEMSHPVPDHIMLDFLSPDKHRVLSRRVLNPLYRNDTIDLVEELEYTEVV